MPDPSPGRSFTCYASAAFERLLPSAARPARIARRASAIHDNAAPAHPRHRTASRPTIMNNACRPGGFGAYRDFFSSFSLRFSLIDFDGFFLTSFLASLDFANTHLLYEFRTPILRSGLFSAGPSDLTGGHYVHPRLRLSAPLRGCVMKNTLCSLTVVPHLCTFVQFVAPFSFHSGCRLPGSLLLFFKSHRPDQSACLRISTSSSPVN